MGGIWRLLVIKEGKGSGVKNVKTKNKNIRTFASEHQDEIFFPAYVFSEKCLYLRYKKAPVCETGTSLKPSDQGSGRWCRSCVLNFSYRGVGHRTFQQWRRREKDALFGNARSVKCICGICSCSTNRGTEGA